MKSFGRKTTAAIMAGLMAVMTAMPAGVALAEEIQPSVGKTDDLNGNHQTGTGVTDVTIQYKQTGRNIGGTEDTENNPDSNPADGLGDNIAFTVPTAINFVSDAQGKLTGPSASVAYIENESMFSIHASAFKTDTMDGWSIVRDGAEVTEQNAIDFQFGPKTEKAGNADAYDYQMKREIADVTSDAPYVADWNMGPKVNEGTADRVLLNTTGDIHNVNKDLSERTRVARIHTYVTAGNAGGSGNGSGGGQQSQGVNLVNPQEIRLVTEPQSGQYSNSAMVNNTSQMTGSLDTFFSTNYGTYDVRYDQYEVTGVTTWEQVIAGFQAQNSNLTAQMLGNNASVLMFYAGDARFGA